MVTSVQAYGEGRRAFEIGAGPSPGYIDATAREYYLDGYISAMALAIKTLQRQAKEDHAAFKQHMEAVSNGISSGTVQGSEALRGDAAVEAAAGEEKRGSSGSIAPGPQICGDRGGTVGRPAEGSGKGSGPEVDLTPSGLAALLRQAKAAHSQYEDHFRIEGRNPPRHDWSDWYARYLIARFREMADDKPR